MERTENEYDYKRILRDEYEIYLTFADDGHGGDITRTGLPLKTFEEWLDS